MEVNKTADIIIDNLKWAEPEGLYIHVPFCSRKCRYCAFISRHPRPHDFREYTDAICRELTAQASSRRAKNPLKSIYFGGGTPSILPAELLCQILDKVIELFGRTGDCEVTLEINPASVSKSDLAELFATKRFNRASVGFQTGSEQLLELIGRDHRLVDFEQTMDGLLACGCKNISADLMFGLPEQTLSDLEHSVQILLSYPLQHVAFYSLMIEPQTVFYRRYHQHPELLPDDETERTMYRLLLKSFEEAGFEHYELSNVARPSYASRHNLLYWQARQYWAVGPAAAGYAYGERWQNPSNINVWLQHWLTSDERLAEVEKISGEDSLREAMWLGLRLIRGVDLTQIRKRYSVDPLEFFADPIARMSEDGL